MAGDHNRRDSDGESEQPSKRHRRHHHRRHRRSRNHDDKDVEIESVVEEKAQSPPKIVPVDNEVEEGEILEEDEDFVAEKRRLDSSDAESGEIKVDADRNKEALRVELDASTCEGQNVENVGCHLMMLGLDKVAVGDDAALSRKRIINGDTKMCDEIDVERHSSVKHYGNFDVSRDKYNKSSRSSSPEGLGKWKGYYRGESEHRRQKTFSNADERNRHTSMGRLALPGRVREKDYRSSRSRSPDRAKEKSQSQSIVDEPSRLQVQQFNVSSSREIRLPKNSDDETISRYDNDYRHGSRDLGEREHSSTNSRHTTREDRYQSSDTQTRFRDKSRETWDREREHRDRPRDKDWEKVQERVRERDRNQEWEREKERERRRERERDGDRRDRHQKIIKDREYDKFTRNRKHSDANTSYADGDNYTDHRLRRPDETDAWDKARRSDADKFQSSKIDNSERDVEKERRDELEQENFQENTVLQLAEKEEEEIDRIKEESRKRKQAILEKFKTRQSQQKLEAKTEVNAKTSLSDEETGSAQDEVAVTPLLEKLFSVEKSPEQIVPPALRVADSGALGGGTPKSEGSDDMFRDDIFGDSPAGVRRSEKGDCLLVERSGLNDNWDDAEGYYSYRFGEILDGRYEVIAAHGKGVFSSVVRAKDLKAGFGDPEEVAIKIIRSNDIMYKAGLEELVILKKLVAADKEDKRHCVRFISSFKYRNHLCLVFESLHMNLREVLKKFGRNIGLKLTAVRTYAKQLFIALKHLRNCGVLHCDIKPDNMLVNDAKNVLKLCDFGNAMFAGKNEVTPYLVSRFYRAPEIILGLQYDHPMDIWSVGCCLYELYTGKVLFPGPSNNDMLRLHMELKGPFPKKMLRKGAFIDHHFDQDLNFLATEEDPVTKKTIKRLFLNIKPKDIGSVVFGSAGDDPKMLSNFKDLLEKIFALDPDKRITVSQTLSHPFITGK